MKYIEEAIREAVEKGEYHKGHQPEISTNTEGVWMSFFGAPFTRTYHQSDIFLDPLFWQALQKAKNWHKHSCRLHLTQDNCGIVQTPTWKNYLHRFIDHLADGGTADDFFKSLT